MNTSNKNTQEKLCPAEGHEPAIDTDGAHDTDLTPDPARDTAHDTPQDARDFAHPRPTTGPPPATPPSPASSTASPPTAPTATSWPT
ncbi:MAG: hypothetical protein M0C28_44925 [Candidatus Moduliflexus flocculans]|nr:hypothetical protein [Candidatus Moduliflexus flocculans]